MKLTISYSKIDIDFPDMEFNLHFPNKLKSNRLHFRIKVSLGIEAMNFLELPSPRMSKHALFFP